MKIALVINQLDLGGSETTVYRIATQATLRGHSVDVYTVRQAGVLGAQLSTQGITTTALGVDGGVRKHPLGLLVAVRRLSRLFAQGHYHVAHSFLFEGNLVTRLAARRARLRTVASFRTNVFTLPAERLFEQTTGQWVSGYTAVSNNTASEAAERLGLSLGRIKTIYNGIRILDPTAPPTRIQRLGFLGRLHREKGLDILLRALQQVPKVELLIAGDGPQKSQLQQLAEQLGVADRATFIGATERPLDFIDSVDAMVIPSRFEGLSNVALEAMARARPVIASDRGGNSEVVKHGQTGYVVAPNDHRALSDAIHGLCRYRHPERLGAAGLQRIRRYFSDQRMLDETIDYWKKVARDPLPYN